MKHLIKSKIQSGNRMSEAATTLHALIDSSYEYYNSPKQSTIIIEGEEIKPLSQKAKEFIRKLKSFKNLQENWDSYGAATPSSIAISNAISFIRLADENELPLYFTAPGPNGEILVEVGEGLHTTEIFFNPNGENEYIVYEGEEITTEGNFQNNFEDFLKAQFA